MPEEVLQGGGGGGDAQETAGVRTPDPFDSNIANALSMEGPVDGGHDVFGLVAAELELLVLDQLKAPLVHRRLRQRRMLLESLDGLDIGKL